VTNDIYDLGYAAVTVVVPYFSKRFFSDFSTTTPTLTFVSDTRPTELYGALTRGGTSGS
jgi:hypothetical protein